MAKGSYDFYPTGPMTPADSYRAVYWLDAPPWFFLDRVVCWCVHAEVGNHDGKRTGNQEVYALVSAGAYLARPDLDDNFMCVIHVDDIGEEQKQSWVEEGKRRASPPQAGQSTRTIVEIE